MNLYPPPRNRKESYPHKYQSTPYTLPSIPYSSKRLNEPIISGIKDSAFNIFKEAFITEPATAWTFKYVLFKVIEPDIILIPRSCSSDTSGLLHVSLFNMETKNGSRSIVTFGEWHKLHPYDYKCMISKFSHYISAQYTLFVENNLFSNKYLHLDDKAVIVDDVIRFNSLHQALCINADVFSILANNRQLGIKICKYLRQIANYIYLEKVNINGVTRALNCVIGSLACVYDNNLIELDTIKLLLDNFTDIKNNLIKNFDIDTLRNMRLNTLYIINTELMLYLSSDNPVPFFIGISAWLFDVRAIALMANVQTSFLVAGLYHIGGIKFLLYNKSTKGSPSSEIKYDDNYEQQIEDLYERYVLSEEKDVLSGEKDVLSDISNVSNVSMEFKQKEFITKNYWRLQDLIYTNLNVNNIVSSQAVTQQSRNVNIQLNDILPKIAQNLNGGAPDLLRPNSGLVYSGGASVVGASVGGFSIKGGCEPSSTHIIIAVLIILILIVVCKVVECVSSGIDSVHSALTTNVSKRKKRPYRNNKTPIY